MRGLFLILVLAVAHSCAEDQCNMTPEAMACRDLLKPKRSEEDKKAILNKCIAAQPGLQATIDKLTAEAKVDNESLPSDGVEVVKATQPSSGTKVANASPPSAGTKVANASLTSTGAEVVKPQPGCKGERVNPAKLLKAAGKTAEVATLNKCFAKEKGYIVVAPRGGTAIFDVAKFKAEIKALVSGTSSQAKTQLGLDKCPETDLATFDICEYMKCVKAYCATGAAPTNKE